MKTTSIENNNKKILNVKNINGLTDQSDGIFQPDIFEPHIISSRPQQTQHKYHMRQILHK